MKRLITLIALLFSFPAFAADLPVYEPPVAVQYEPAINWTGGYVGLGVGGGATCNDISFTGMSLDCVGGQGFIGDVILGYDWQLGSRWVVGARIGAAYQDLETSAVAAPFALTAEPEWVGTMSLRAGLLPNESTLLYAIGGYSYLDSYTVSITGVGTFKQRYNSGWHIGGGAEVFVSPSFTIGGEYLYTDHGSSSWGVSGLSVSPSTHTAMFRMNWRPQSGLFGRR